MSQSATMAAVSPAGALHALATAAGFAVLVLDIVPQVRWADRRHGGAGWLFSSMIGHSHLRQGRHRARRRAMRVADRTARFLRNIGALGAIARWHLLVGPGPVAVAVVGALAYSREQQMVAWFKESSRSCGRHGNESALGGLARLSGSAVRAGGSEVQAMCAGWSTAASRYPPAGQTFSVAGSQRINRVLRQRSSSMVPKERRRGSVIFLFSMSAKRRI